MAYHVSVRIGAYSFGSISVDGRTYGSDVVIYPERVQDQWWRKRGHWLDEDDLKAVVADGPKVLIVGTGYYGNMEVPRITRNFLLDRGIELHVAPTREAVALYNTMCESAAVVAALHLTC